MRRLFALLLAISFLGQLPAFGKPKRKTYNNSAEQVFDAALRTARERHVVTYVDDKHSMFTFETGKSLTSYGFIANASVEAESDSKATLIINVQQKDKKGFSLNAGDRMADKFYEQVEEELARMPTQKTAVKPEAPAVAVPPAPIPEKSSVENGTVIVTSSPSGSDVSVDGSFVGNAPASLKLAPGKHTVEVVQSGYKSWSRELTILPGAETRLNATLTKE